MMHKIPIFKLHYDESDRVRLQDGMKEILEDGYLTNHRFVRQFETEFANWNNSKFALAVSNGTTALEVILRGIDVRGREVILPANTFIACAVAVLNAGGIPVICDIELDYLSLNPQKVKEKINRNTAALITVHIGGIISPYIEQLKQICADHNCFLVEDCAHAHGASLNGVRAGNFGVAGAFSFHMTKVMTTGEGGMVVTGDESLAKKIESIRQFGKSDEQPLMHVRDGGNFKMTEMQGLFGTVELKRVESRIARRKKIASIYDELLKNTDWKTYVSAPQSECPYYKKIILSPVARSLIETEFSKRNISLTGGVYYFPLNKQTALKQFVRDEYPNANYFSENHICPPCYPELADEEAVLICKTLLSISN